MTQSINSQALTTLRFCDFSIETALCGLEFEVIYLIYTDFRSQICNIALFNTYFVPFLDPLVLEFLS